MVEQSRSHELSLDPVTDLKEVAGPLWDVRPGLHSLSLHYPYKADIFHIYLSQRPNKPAGVFVKVGDYTFHANFDTFSLIRSEHEGERGRLMADDILELDFEKLEVTINSEDESKVIDIKEEVEKLKVIKPAKWLKKS